MKLCWLLGMLTLVRGEGNDVIKENASSTTTTPEGIGTIHRPEDQPPGINKTLAKRQTGPPDDQAITIDEPINIDPGWNDNLISFWPTQDKRTRFSSWAGKRDPDESYENKRARFSSWAGKRAKFSSWAGKRDYLSDLYEKKKLLAHALAGYSQDLSDYGSNLDNLNKNSVEDLSEEKRGKFSSWGGKRGDTSYESKRKFSSWSGKRSLDHKPYKDLSTDLYVSPEHYLETNPDQYRENEELSKSLQENIIRSNFKNSDQKNYDVEGSDDWSDPDFGLSMDKRDNTPSRGGKRKFSSWGGKRSGYLMDTNTLKDDISEVEKRARFSSWAGKRGLSPFWKSNFQGKRGKFSSWAGKRSDNSLEPFNEEEKRTRFSSWGGKRDYGDSLDSYEDKRAKFSSWAGKRIDNDEEDFSKNYNKRDANWGSPPKKKVKGRGFSSWGGKRSYWENDDNVEPQFNNALGNINEFKRTNKFSSWAGKRSQDLEVEKRKFSSWGGKRDYFGLVEQPKRARFSSWAGKRSVDPNDGPEVVNKRKEGRKSGLLRRYNRFNSWRGKKDNVTPLNSTGQNKLEDVNFNQSDNFIKSNKSKRGFTNYYRQFEMIKRNPLIRAWIGRNYPDSGLMTWKRKPAFSSWGGKRSLTQETVGEMPQTYDDVEEEKKGRFSSWGGKRHTLEKRSIRTTTDQIFHKMTPNKKNPRTSKLFSSRGAIDSHFYLRSSKNSLLASAIQPMRRQFFAWGG